MELILKEKPAVAILDSMLPVLSGIEVCERIRLAEEDNRTKLILFTADARPETRDRALYVGADAVVLKSSEATDIIDATIKVLAQDEEKVSG